MNEKKDFFILMQYNRNDALFKSLSCAVVLHNGTLLTIYTHTLMRAGDATRDNGD